MKNICSFNSFFEYSIKLGRGKSVIERFLRILQPMLQEAIDFFCGFDKNALKTNLWVFTIDTNEKIKYKHEEVVIVSNIKI